MRNLKFLVFTLFRRPFYWPPLSRKNKNFFLFLKGELEGEPQPDTAATISGREVAPG